MALNVALSFTHNVIIAQKRKLSYQKAPMLLVHGGTGSGKLTFIKSISQNVNQLLKKEGDNPDCPYILLSAYTGTAAANIDGQTLHTLFPLILALVTSP